MSSSIAGIKAIIRPIIRTTIRNTLASVIQEVTEEELRATLKTKNFREPLMEMIQSMNRVQPDKERPAAEASPKRIETQIHRRKKAKAVSPLTDEWEGSQAGPPKGLKRPPQDMRKANTRVHPY